VERATEPNELARTLRGATRTPARVASRATDLGRSLRSLLGSSPIAPRTSLNHRVTRGRRFAGVRLPLEDVQAVRSAVGGTVNDVVLTGVGSALRRRLVARGESPPAHLRVLCPVSVRDERERMQLGNRIAAMFVDLPLDPSDPAERLRVVSAGTAALKEQEQAAGTAFLIELSDFAAPAVLALAARVVHRQPFVNLVVTNLPGPPFPLYCMGARLLEAYPIVPLSQNLSLGVAILSYCGSLHVGLYADDGSWPDLDELAAEIGTAFAELRHAGAPESVEESASA
jgi:diacylglycerol O-acyltransferase